MNLSCSKTRSTPGRVLGFRRKGLSAYVPRSIYCPRKLHAPLWCPVIDGCNAVVNSPYSHVFGVPLSYFGFVYYLYMFGLATCLAFEPFSNSLRFRAILYTAMGAASSMYFTYLQLGFIREVCSYCLIAAVTSFLLLLAALWHFQATRSSSRFAPKADPPDLGLNEYTS